MKFPENSQYLLIKHLVHIRDLQEKLQLQISPESPPEKNPPDDSTQRELIYEHMNLW